MTICIKERYFSFNRISLLAIGLWPYQQSTFAQIQMVFIFGILISFITFQLSRLLFVEWTLNFTLKMLSIASLFTIYAIKYITTWINIETIRYLLERLQHIYNELKDKNEIAIYEKYGNTAKRLTINLLIVDISILSVGFVMEIWPYIFDVIMPKNETYARHLIILMCKYYSIEEKYYYYIILHASAATAVGVFALAAIGTIMISCIKYICGMFKIASYRLERAMTITNTLQNISLKNEFVICKEIIHAVDIHRKAMEFTEYLVSNFEKSYAFMIGIAVFCVSLNLYRVSRIEPMKDKEETVVHVAITFFTLFYIFIANNVGQEIIDNNNHVFFTAYNIPWYLAPLQIQKLILFLLQRSSKAFTLNFQGLFIASLECFASLASASVSYFTIMYSVA
ncbi:hypothetical protein DMN91_004356 [Ooceraea biroi]|uniref:Odorant receptor n=1 Tax=Ooceraea biroi TaxID=2015173 RepID=A0A026X0X5_OOCBI|nr:hypothetical protein X777_07964 [Ooceraea biroi]RLU24146.1 hypothetical protein DMN91_004356 [Ooceraea biroi]